MLNIKSWLDNYVSAVGSTFGERIYFIGLQGSFARGEASEGSDIDVVLILDTLSAEDLKRYRNILGILPDRELICGFVSGRDELLKWEPSDLFQFYYDTLPVKGTLNRLLEVIDKSDVKRAVKIGACNIYHGCAHNLLHERDSDILRGLYKSAEFTIRAICFLRDGAYIRGREELLRKADAAERKILENGAELKASQKIGSGDLERISEDLFLWSQSLIRGC